MKKMKTTIKSFLFVIIGSLLLFAITSSDAQELESEAKSQEEIDRELEKELAKIQEAYEEDHWKNLYHQSHCLQMLQ
jgi:hypothetical protein